MDTQTTTGPKTYETLRERLLEEIPVRERRLELAGVPTAVLEGGGGPPVVLLHGPGEYGAKWLRVIPELVRSHRVVAPDLPGHGESGGFEGEPEVEDLLDWLGALVEETCEDPPVLVGQILGGAIAARFAARHGDRIAQLVLSDALGLAPFEPAPEFGAALQRFMEAPDEETHDRLWERCAHDLDALRDDMDERWERVRAYNLDRARAAEHADTRRALMRLFGIPAIPPEELVAIDVPTALIWGRHDLATALAVAEDASDRHGWPLHVIEGAADDPPMERPSAFLDALVTAIDLGARRAAWDRIAPGYDAFNTLSHMGTAEEALRRAGLRPGMRFLDVAAGSGAVSLPAARMGARVLATDHSPTMLRHLGERARSEGLDIEARVMDGHDLRLDDDAFDMAGSQFGVMLFPDMPRGIREMARVVRPGGTVFLTSFGDPREIEFLGFMTRGLRSVRPDFEGLPLEPPPLPLQLSDPARLRAELATAGLTDVRVESFTETLRPRSGRELWDWLVWSNPIVEDLLAELAITEPERQTIRETLEALVRERAAGAETAELIEPILVGIGRNP